MKQFSIEHVYITHYFGLSYTNGRRYNLYWAKLLTILDHSLRVVTQQLFTAVSVITLRHGGSFNSLLRQIGHTQGIVSNFKGYSWSHWYIVLIIWEQIQNEMLISKWHYWLKLFLLIDGENVSKLKTFCDTNTT